MATRATAPAEKKPRAKRTSASLPKQAAGHHQVVSTALAPAAIGPYSQAVVATGPFLFVSGCIGLHPQTMDFTGADVSTQTEQVMQNMGAILEAGGSSFAEVVKCTILLTDMQHFATVNDIYAKYFPRDPPARATFATNGLPKGALVEIECIASLAQKTTRTRKAGTTSGRGKAKQEP